MHARRLHHASTEPHTCRLELHAPASPRRAAVEALIRNVYDRRYGAQPPAFTPVLASLSGAHGVVAAAGYRAARDEPLFLERYLGRPIEHCLPQTGGEHVPRAQIVEVGHLAATRAGEGRRLIHCLTQHLVDEGYTWVVSTVTRELRALFLRLGITPLALGAADPHKLGDERHHWGRYYEHEPVILAGHLPQAISRLDGAHRRSATDAPLPFFTPEGQP